MQLRHVVMVDLAETDPVPDRGRGDNDASHQARAHLLTNEPVRGYAAFAETSECHGDCYRAERGVDVRLRLQEVLDAHDES